MTARAPAKPWYDLVVETIALRGWSKTELAERAEIARSTIDEWQRNLRPPQAAKVNAVADVLGIDRAQALRLAGVITDGQSDGRPPPSLLDDGIGREDADRVRDALRQVYPDEAEEIIAGMEEKLRKRRAAGR
jgi:transcriptional regulator with XRE-family HTH domain